MSIYSFIYSLVLFCFLNFNLFFIALVIIYHFSNRDSKIHLILSIVSVYLFQIILFLIILGSLKQLNAVSAFIFSTVCLILTIVFLKQNIFTLFKFLKELFCLPNIKASFFILIFLFLFSLILFHMLKNESLRFPSNGDCLSYHLPTVVNWLQTNNIWSIFYYGTDGFGFQSYYPPNNELFSLWLMLPFKSDLALNLQNIFIVLWGAMAIFGLCKLINPTGRLAFPLSLIFISLPLYYHNPNMILNTSLADILCGSAFIASVYWLFSFRKNESFLNLVIFSLTLGIFIGSKTSAPFYSLPLILLFLHSIYRGRASLLWKIRGTIIWFSGVIIMGGFWFIRNAILYGNPIFNYKVTLFGKTLFKGVDFHYNESLFSLLDIGLILKTIKIHLFKGEGIILIFTLVILLFTVIKFIIKNIRARYFAIFISKIADNYILGVSFLFLLLCYFNIPLGEFFALYDQAGCRYGIPYMACMLSFIGTINTGKSIWKRKLLLFVIFCSFLWNAIIIIKKIDLAVFLMSITFLSIIYFLFSNYNFKLLRYLRRGEIILVTLIIIFIFFPVHMYANRNELFFEERPYGKAYQWAAENINESRIAYAGLHEIYPLYGGRYQNIVRYINPNGYIGYDYYDYFKLFTDKRILEDSNVYAYSYIYSDIEQDINVQYTGTKAYIYMNDFYISSASECNSKIECLNIQSHLKKGLNKILLKLIVENGYKFSIRIVDREGNSIKNLQYFIKKPMSTEIETTNVKANPITKLLMNGLHKSENLTVKDMIEKDYLDGERDITPINGEIWGGKEWRIIRPSFPYFILNLYFSGKINYRILYGHLYLYSDIDRKALFNIAVSRKAGYKVFINGVPIGVNYCDDNNSDEHNVKFRSGWNRIMIKIAYLGSNRLALSTKISDNNGNMIKGLRYELNKPFLEDSKGFITNWMISGYYPLTELKQKLLKLPKEYIDSDNKIIRDIFFLGWHHYYSNSSECDLKKYFLKKPLGVFYNREDKSYECWVRTLYFNEIHYIFIGKNPLFPEHKWELDIIHANKSLFMKVYEDKEVSIWKFNPQGLSIPNIVFADNIARRLDNK